MASFPNSTRPSHEFGSEHTVITLSHNPPAMFVVTCMGSASDFGTPTALIEEHLHDREGGGRAWADDEVLRSALGDTVRMDSEFGGGTRVLTEWFTLHEGWIFGVRYMHDWNDNQHESAVEASFTTWEWQ